MQLMTSLQVVLSTVSGYNDYTLDYTLRFELITGTPTIGAAVSSTVTHDAPESLIATAAAALTNDQCVIVADSRRGAR